MNNDYYKEQIVEEQNDFDKFFLATRANFVILGTDTISLTNY